MRWRRRRLAPIPDPPSAVRVIPTPAGVPALDEFTTWRPPDTCPDCTPSAPCLICRALGTRTTRPQEDTPA